VTRTDPGNAGAAAAPEKQRADKWLWHARFFKTRGLAAGVISAGKLRVNGNPVRKPSFGVRPGDKLTFPQGRQIRVIEILAFATRRGPAVEAQKLYADHTVVIAKTTPDGAPVPSAGKPSRKDRRVVNQTRRSVLE